MKVDMQVTQCIPHPDENMAEVWGYVGDYEVMVCLPLDDPRVQEHLPKAGRVRKCAS